MRISDWSSDVCSSDLRATGKNQRCRSDAHTYITLVFGDEATGEKVSAGVAINAREKDDRHHIRGHYVVRGLELSLDDHLQVTSDRKSKRLHSSHSCATRMPSSA